MPKLIRFVIINSAIGIVIGWVFAALLLILNIGGTGELFMRSDAKLIIGFLLALSSGITFGFAYLASAIMLMPKDKRDFDKL